MKQHRDTLVILTPAFPEDEADYIWVPSQQLFVKTLQHDFPQLHIVVLSFFFPNHTNTYNWHHTSVTSFNGMSKRKLRRPLLWKDIWQQLNATRKQHNVIGILSFWCGECALIGRYFAKRHALQHICWICGQDARVTNNLVKFIRPPAHELAAMSAFLANEFYKNHGVKPQHIIHNAIDPQLFPVELPKVRDIDIMGAGSLVPLKQYDQFVRIVGALQQKLPHIRAIHCGGGEEEGRLKALISDMGLTEHLSLLGKTPQAGVVQLMQRAKVFLHTSSYEGLSTACLEALYAGAHVISFCDPMDAPIAKWHIVKTAEEMTAKALAVLTSPHTDYTPVLAYSMTDSVQAVMKLFKDTPT